MHFAQGLSNLAQLPSCPRGSLPVAVHVWFLSEVRGVSKAWTVHRHASTTENYFRLMSQVRSKKEDSVSAPVRNTVYRQHNMSVQRNSPHS